MISSCDSVFIFIVYLIPPEVMICVCVCVWVHTHAQLCLALCNPMDCSPLASSVHVIFQARILKWVAIPFSRGSSRPKDRTQVSCIAGKFFTVCEVCNIVQKAVNKTIPKIKKKREGKVVIWGGFTKSRRMKRSKKQGKEGKIYSIKLRVPKNN